MDHLWAQFGLQFVLAAMSVRGAVVWRADERARRTPAVDARLVADATV